MHSIFILQAIVMFILNLALTTALQTIGDSRAESIFFTVSKNIHFSINLKTQVMCSLGLDCFVDHIYGCVFSAELIK
jgi:hypothetical protein